MLARSATIWLRQTKKYNLENKTNNCSVIGARGNEWNRGFLLARRERWEAMKVAALFVESNVRWSMLMVISDLDVLLCSLARVSTVAGRDVRLLV